MRLRKQKATGEKTIYTDIPYIEEGWIWVLQRTELTNDSRTLIRKQNKLYQLV